MPVLELTNLEDARLAPFRDLKDHELARAGDRFSAVATAIFRHHFIYSDCP